jgi:hypothetical protein
MDVWIRTEPTLDDDGYMVTLSVGEDAAVTMTPDRAFAYARTLLGHIARADHDAAVVRQMRKVIGTDAKAMRNIAQLILDMRSDRPPLDDESTAPLRYEPGVNQSHKGFIACFHQGEQFGTWSLKAAKRHALGMIEVVENANLDAAYLRALTGLVGIDKPRALNVIDDLAKFRTTD